MELADRAQEIQDAASFVNKFTLWTRNGPFTKLPPCTASRETYFACALRLGGRIALAKARRSLERGLLGYAPQSEAR